MWFIEQTKGKANCQKFFSIESSAKGKANCQRFCSIESSGLLKKLLRQGSWSQLNW